MLPEDSGQRNGLCFFMIGHRIDEAVGGAEAEDSVCSGAVATIRCGLMDAFGVWNNPQHCRKDIVLGLMGPAAHGMDIGLGYRAARMS